jgi:negative regulator of sigma E activity
MGEKHAEALSAFFDGERVDADLLAESLAEPGSSALLAEFAAMRRHVERDLCRPRPEFLQTTAEKLRRLRARRLWRRRFAKLAFAASVLAAVGIGGFGLGSVSERQRNQLTAHVVSRPISTATQVKPSQLPPTAPPGRNVVKPSKRRPRQQAGAPPVAALRLRFGQWRDPSSPVGAEGQRH